MTNKLNCIKKGAKYIIGAAVLATSLSSAVFGLNKEGFFNNGEYYQICNEKDLREFAELVNSGEETGAKGKLMNDIDLDCKNFGEWIPIGTDNSPFQGELISNNNEIKTITGLYINKEDNDYQGLFGYIEEKGKLENIVIDGSIHGKDNIGGIAGYNKGTINNCYATIKIKGNDNVGGNVGYNNGTIMKICCNKGGRVEGKYNVGGNVGYNKGIISGYCSNGVEVNGRETVGGNVGWNEGAISGCCSNIGAVIGGPYKGCYIGGNVGWNKGEIESCENSGKIITKGLCVYVGGNVGCSEGTIKNCRNSGKVTGNNEIRRIVGLNKEEGEDNGAITGESHFGGNVGKNNGKIVTCENFGHVITENGEYVGGNIGYIESTGTVEQCINNGLSQTKEIECQGKEYVGGNVGFNKGTIKVRCENSATVYGEENIGGNVGKSIREILGDGTNEGDIIGYKCVGGNIGYNVGKIGGKCNNSGDIEGYFKTGEDFETGRNFEVGGNIGYNSKYFGHIGGELINKGNVNGESADNAKIIGVQY